MRDEASDGDLDDRVRDSDAFAPDVSGPDVLGPDAIPKDATLPESPPIDDGTTDGPVFETPSSFTDVPVKVAGMAFNEPMNKGFDSTIAVTGHATSFRASSAGRISGTITASYGGPIVSATARRDVLFVSVTPMYVMMGYGDMFGVALVKPTGFVASYSTDTTATFAVDVPLPVPIPVVVGSDPLRWVNVDFTWVRAYQHASGNEFHVLPGAGPPSPYFVAKWDELVEFDHRFAYYAPILASAVAPEFDYPGWLTAHAPF